MYAGNGWMCSGLCILVIGNRVVDLGKIRKWLEKLLMILIQLIFNGNSIKRFS